jgi:hypothetical protein
VALLATTAISVSSASADAPYGTPTAGVHHPALPSPAVRAQHAALHLSLVRPGTSIEQVRGLAAERHNLAVGPAPAPTRIDWTAAAIGALAALAVILVVTASALGVRRRHEATTA